MLGKKVRYCGSVAWKKMPAIERATMTGNICRLRVKSESLVNERTNERTKLYIAIVVYISLRSQFRLYYTCNRLIEHD